MDYRREIDGLRAIAVVPVILFHAGFEFCSGGFVGVDVFFVISGYLITSIIYAEIETSTFSLAQFYERRARRILPALFVVLLVTFPFAWLWFLPIEMKEFSQSLVAVTSFSSNFLFWLKSGYFEAKTELKPLLHTWSLSVEEQYYLLFPLLLHALWRVGKKALLITLSVGTFASLCLAHLWSTRYPEATFYLLPTRVWELLLGSMIAVYQYKITIRDHLPAKQQKVLPEVASIGGLCLILYATFSYDKTTPFPGLYALAPTLGAALIIMYTGPSNVVGRWLGSGPLVGIGLISYSAYLWHQPIFAFAKYTNLSTPGPLWMAGLSLLCFVLAFLTWKFVEKPFRDRARISRRSIVAFSVCGSVAFFALGLGGQLTNGMNERIAPPHLPPDYLLYTTQLKKNDRGIEGNACISVTASSCEMTRFKDGKRKYLLVGDSHSADYATEFRSFLNQNQFNGWQMSVGGCAFIASQFQVWAGECGRARTHLERLVVREKFDEVILIGDYFSHTKSIAIAGRNADIESLVALIRHISSTGARVVVFMPRRPFSIDPMRATFLDRRERITFEPMKENIDAWSRTLRTIAAEGRIRLFDEPSALYQLGCGKEECFIGNSLIGLPMYRDTNHLSDYGAKLAFDKFLRWDRETKP